MKARVLFLGFLMIAMQSNAQQKPHYTQYILNQYALNPALAGIENYIDVKMSHRRQWVGLSGAPVTSYLTVHAPLGKKDYKTTALSFDINGENPLGERYWEEYTAAPAHHGVGLQVYNDQIGPFTDFSAYATYAYHIPVGTRTNLSAGVGFGMGNLSLNTDKLFFGNQNPIDPAVAGSGNLRKMRFNARAGLWLYNAEYFAGISVLDIMPQTIDFANNTARLAEGKWKPHIFATGGFRGMLNDDINFIPSVMIKYINPVPMQFDANVKLLYRNLLWGGATYRHKYGFAAFAGINIKNLAQISYSYDYSITPLNRVSNGSHEIMLGFIFGNEYSKNTCPNCY